jgi:hypothetical protein
MADIPRAIITVLDAFAPLFSRRIFMHVKLLLVGAILAPGKRTVTAVLQVRGKGGEAHFQNYHRVFNRACWSSLDARRMLLGLLLEAFVPKGPVVMGLDETSARRRGEKISATGIYRDPGRSSHAHVVKTSGRRWVSLMLLTRIPWADRVWALPFLPVLAPSERYDQSRGRQAQSLLDRARQAWRLGRRWLPTRELVVVGDNTYSALAWLDAVRQAAGVITRLRLDAALYAPAPPRRPRQHGRPRKTGVRLPTLAPQALLSTKLALDPVQLLTWFVQCWQLETTCEEARAHLGLETPRQWNDRSVSRTTPALFGLHSIVTLAAARLIGAQPVPVWATAWYPKHQATFSDTIALVRRSLWPADQFAMSPAPTELVKIPLALRERLTETLCYAA